MLSLQLRGWRCRLWLRWGLPPSPLGQKLVGFKSYSRDLSTKIKAGTVPQHKAVMVQSYEPLRQALCARSGITLAHLLSAREDLSVITKTTCESSREKTACPVNKVLMGPVPDRGGRPGEMEAPMPTWEDRRSGGGGGGGGRKQKWRGKGRKHK